MQSIAEPCSHPSGLGGLCSGPEVICRALRGSDSHRYDALPRGLYRASRTGIILGRKVSSALGGVTRGYHRAPRAGVRTGGLNLSLFCGFAASSRGDYASICGLHPPKEMAAIA